MSTRAPEVEVIRLWIKDGRSREVDSLRPAEIGGARHRDRLLDCAIIDGVLYIERRVAPTVREPLGRHLVEVYVADALYAKNERGASSVSAPRMAATSPCKRPATSPTNSGWPQAIPTSTPS